MRSDQYRNKFIQELSFKKKKRTYAGIFQINIKEVKEVIV
jgi:hypothetical protein